MLDRDTGMRAFLSEAGWADAMMSPLAGDASNRRYLRLNRASSGEKAVLMDAPPSKGEDVRPFIHIAKYLTASGYSAPRIFAQDESLGYLLLEDLGDALFARVIRADPALEPTLYAAATDLLVDLHRHTPPADLLHYDPPAAADLSALVLDWYAPSGETARSELASLMQSALATYAPDCKVLVQRDYHAENLLWLPDRLGLERVGLLDFQDAALGHPSYDLVSLLQDARRDVPPEIEAQMVERYIDASEHQAEEFHTAYAVMGAQRNLRILGVFARLCLRDGKADYVDLIPRVWGLLQRDLAHPALAPLKLFVSDTIPAPSQDVLRDLKAKCA